MPFKKPGQATRDYSKDIGGVYRSCPSVSTSRSLQLSGAEMSKFFQFPPSKASIFLAAMNSTYQGTEKEGTLLWEKEHLFQRNVSLGEDGTQILVKEQGYYLVFAQATFKVPNQSSKDLMLRVDVQYNESSEQFSAIFRTHYGKQSYDGGESDVVLSKPILLWLVPGDRLAVVTHPWQLVEYEKHPISTFLTVFKYSD
ncbi:hypothetical protein AAFF_G00129940 [Aldrovandia affinis]|uniref:THD domain-containing protein n=1 Tax=Aldrovandia affinis TaxID=143900 RepID=A0AAD7RTK5_9TELE|nr:hypothetical protein AAFF_G00129940 [Aldrovandia affinis]